MDEQIRDRITDVLGGLTGQGEEALGDLANQGETALDDITGNAGAQAEGQLDQLAGDASQGVGGVTETVGNLIRKVTGG